VYNLPSSLAEYLSAPCQEEAAYVRLLLYRGGGGGGGGNNKINYLINYRKSYYVQFGQTRVFLIAVG